MTETLRPFQPADLGPLHALVARTIETSYAGVYCRSAIDHFHGHHSAEQIRKDAADGFTLVAEHAGLLVGTGTVAGEHIGRMYVAPEHQGRGLGRRILDALEQRARDDGRESVYLGASIPARTFYERLGYGLVREDAHEFADGGRLVWFRMVKRL